jgi:hypothetical protein
MANNVLCLAWSGVWRLEYISLPFILVSGRSSGCRTRGGFSYFNVSRPLSIYLSYPNLAFSLLSNMLPYVGFRLGPYLFVFPLPSGISSIYNPPRNLSMPPKSLTHNLFLSLEVSKEIKTHLLLLPGLRFLTIVVKLSWGISFNQLAGLRVYISSKIKQVSQSPHYVV